MNVQFLSNEKGKKTAVVIPIKDWEEIQEKLKLKDSDFWEELPVHVKEGIGNAQKQSLAGETKPHDEVMKKHRKFFNSLSRSFQEMELMKQGKLPEPDISELI